MGRWISFEEAAALAAATTGELANFLSSSGCVEVEGAQGDLSAPPNYPRVRVSLDPIAYSICQAVVVAPRGVGAVLANKICEEDLLAWFADRSTRMLRGEVH